MGDAALIMGIITSLAQIIVTASGRQGGLDKVGQINQVLSLVMGVSQKIGVLGALVQKLQDENRPMTQEEWDTLDNSLSLAAARAHEAVRSATV